MMMIVLLMASIATWVYTVSASSYTTIRQNRQLVKDITGVVEHSNSIFQKTHFLTGILKVSQRENM